MVVGQSRNQRETGPFRVLSCAVVLRIYMRKLATHVALLAATCLLAACATDRSFGTASEIEVTQLEQLPQPEGEIFYVIGPQERLDIAVVGSELFTGTYLTDQKGNVQFPLIGEVPTGGLAPSDASDLIADGLRGRYLTDPQVRVIPQEFPLPSISVGGQVKKPGSYPAQGRQTLLRIVNEAEGLAEYAKYDDVLVMRTVNNQRYIGVYNIEAIQRGNYPDPILYPNDVVMVGDSPARRRLDSIFQFAPLLTASAILIDRLGR